MFPTYLVKFLLGNIASMLRESLTKPPLGLSYVYKGFAFGFLARDSVNNIFGHTVDRTINFECFLQTTKLYKCIKLLNHIRN
jgi:hypothetical protein